MLVSITTAKNLFIFGSPPASTEAMSPDGSAPQVLGCSSYSFLARFAYFCSHGCVRRAGRELWNGSPQVLIQRIPKFLENLASLWRSPVALTVIKPWLFHWPLPYFRGVSAQSIALLLI
jgi:hypothetical protein